MYSTRVCCTVNELIGKNVYEIAFSSFLLAGGMVRRIQLQRSRKIDLSLRGIGGHIGPLPVSSVSSSGRSRARLRPPPSGCKLPGAAVRVALHRGIEGGAGQALAELRLRYLHREVHRVLLRLREPGDHRRDGGSEARVHTYLPASR